MKPNCRWGYLFCLFFIVGTFLDMQTKCCALTLCYLFHDASVGESQARGLLTWSGTHQEYCDVPEDPDQEPGYYGEPLIEFPDTDGEICKSESDGGTYQATAWESYPDVGETLIEVYPGHFVPELHRIQEL